MSRKVPVLDVSYDSFLDVRNIGEKVFSPINGFLNKRDYQNVVKNMRLASGSPWPIPVTLDVPEDQRKALSASRKIHLRFRRKIIASMYPVDLYKADYSRDILRVFGTDDLRHPGVKKETLRSPYRIGGVINLNGQDGIKRSGYSFKPGHTRELFKKRGWKTVAGFQTRNPVHRAHEYLQRVALELVDGIFIQPLLGWRKPGDFSSNAVVAAYKEMINNFYPPGRVVLGSLNTAMRYAGPREAVFHALIRKNYGCTHFIVGRDHAGVGSYYGKYAAHALCDKFKNLGITIIKLHGPFYCKRCGGIVTEKTCRHGKKYIKDVSGTLIRGFIREGRRPPPEFMRREVTEALIKLNLKRKAFNA